MNPESLSKTAVLALHAELLYRLQLVLLQHIVSSSLSVGIAHGLFYAQTFQSVRKSYGWHGKGVLIQPIAPIGGKQGPPAQ